MVPEPGLFTSAAGGQIAGTSPMPSACTIWPAMSGNGRRIAIMTATMARACRRSLGSWNLWHWRCPRLGRRHERTRRGLAHRVQPRGEHCRFPPDPGVLAIDSRLSSD